jgi:Mn-dependent DtxR family transcriptional regulator
LFEKFKPLEEDILKYIFEADQKKVDISRLTQVFRYVNGDIERIIQNLISEKYVILNENFLLLTPAGEEIAELIFRIHNEIEDYIKGRNLICNAHQMAHILEHRLTEDEIEKMIKASELKEKGIPLANFSLPSGTIVEVALKNCSIWTKLVSIGVFPGQKIHILSGTSSNYLIEIKNSKFAIDSKLAENIFLIP